MYEQIAARVGSGMRQASISKIGGHFVWKRSSHIYIRRNSPFAQISVPDHRELHTGTLREIIKQTGLTVDEFVELL